MQLLGKFRTWANEEIEENEETEVTQDTSSDICNPATTLHKCSLCNAKPSWWKIKLESTHR